MRKPRPKLDSNQIAAALVSKVTGQPIPKGDDLLLSPELQRQYDEALRKDSQRNKRK